MTRDLGTGRIMGSAPGSNNHLKLAIVGATGGLNVSESLRRAAVADGHSVQYFGVEKADPGSRLLRSLAWHLADRRPPLLNRFSTGVVESCAKAPPDVLIATGISPLTATALKSLRAMGVVCINYSTDDPWNPSLGAGWHLRALLYFHHIFTPRRANIEQFRQIGCADVSYLPFGYDEWLFSPPDRTAGTPVHDVMFVGGADRDRVAFVTEFMRHGPPICLVGGFWERYRETRPFTIGLKPPEDLRLLTAAAKVNLCLVRRANRDGHVMRSFEIAAIGGCMLAEDTTEHREIFGANGETVVYFSTPEEAADRAVALIADPVGRARLSSAIRKRIASGGHTYRDRLSSMLSVQNGSNRNDGHNTQVSLTP